MDSTNEPAAADAIPRLTSAAAAGDESAFRQLFAQYHGRVYRYALVVASGNETQARETAQEVFLRFHRHLQPFLSEEGLWAWLALAARSVLIDSSRSRARQLKLKDGFEQHILVDSSSGPDSALLPKLRSCFATLAPDERQLIEYFYSDKKSVQQISETMGTTYKAVESKLSRVRTKLRQLLLKSPNDE